MGISYEIWESMRLHNTKTFKNQFEVHTAHACTAQRSVIIIHVYPPFIHNANGMHGTANGMHGTSNGMHGTARFFYC